MATKKKNEGVQPEAVAEKGSENQVKVTKEEPKVQEAQKPQKFSIATTDGRVIDNVKVKYDKGMKVQVDFGTPKPTEKDPRNGMHQMAERTLTPAQSAEYQRLAGIDKKQALEYAVKAAFPMHYDGAAFNKKDAEVNGRHVNYINIETVSEKTLLKSALHKDGVDVASLDANGLNDAIAKMDPAKKEAVLKEGASRIGTVTIAFGEKDNTENRFLPRALNVQERAMLWNRAEVEGKMVPVLDRKTKQPLKDANGKDITRFEVTKIGAPITLADLASRVEQRVNARTEKMEGAKKVDWGRYYLPEGAKVTQNWHYEKLKNDPDRVKLVGEVNGAAVEGVLSKNETTALRNGMATFDQAAMANSEIRKKVLGIVALLKSQGVSEKAAVDAIVERAKDSTAKSFTPEQKETLKAYAASKGSEEERPAIFEGLWEKAAVELSALGTNEKWQQQAHDELTKLGVGQEVSEQQGMKR